MQLCIFEGINYERLEPLIFSRPTYDLVCGINTLREKILRAYPGIKYSLHCRPYLETLMKVQNPGIDINKIEDNDCLFINGRVLPPADLNKIIPLKNKGNKTYVSGDTLVAARVSGKSLQYVKDNLYDLLSQANFPNIPEEKVNLKVIDYVWDLINNTGAEFLADYKFLLKKDTSSKKKKIRGKVFDGAHFVEKENIFIDDEAQVKPGVVLDASGGPIYVDKNAIIFPNAVIEGPVYVGESAQVKSSARVYENVSVGKVCKVGGEVEHSTFLPYTNKQHAGFLGHSYLGSWINIGADTNGSDLKNNYGSVKVYVNGEVVNSGCQFLGLIMGDHSKTAINTMFNTGTVVGFSSNIFGPGFPDKYIPSFSWGGSDAVTTYDLERSIETAKRMLLRRDRTMHDAEEKLFRKIFDLTKKERRKRGYPY
jgi:UDP-N-acetylglucosamine diphosphorylase/glucosamine-1-phosphate N-acetyltransferase